MSVKVYATLSRFPELEPYLQMQFSIIPRSLIWLGSYPSAEISQRILSPVDSDRLFEYEEEVSLGTTLTLGSVKQQKKTEFFLTFSQYLIMLVSVQQIKLSYFWI